MINVSQIQYILWCNEAKYKLKQLEMVFLKRHSAYTVIAKYTTP